MRLIVHARQAFGKSLLEALLARGDDVVAVYCPPASGANADPLREFALYKGFEVHQPACWDDPAVLEQMKTHKADLCVMAGVTTPVPEQALNIPLHGTIELHLSLLPMHRGPSPVKWAIVRGERKTGVTVFWPDTGLDTGPVLLQKEVDIGPHDTSGSLYENGLQPLGVQALLEAIDRVSSGTAEKTAQDSTGSYEGWFRREQAMIDWSKPAADVYNLIRGCDPQPGAWTVCDGKTLQIFDCRLSEHGSGAPGELIATDANGMLIAAGTGAIVVSRVRLDGSGKMAAGEFLEYAGVSTGSTFC